MVLVGASGAGKTHWAESHFAPGSIVSSDELRAKVGLAPQDLRASKDAFDVLALILERRSRRGLTTVVDSTGLDAKQRSRWLGIARAHGLPAHAVVFVTDDCVCRSRNRQRPNPVPSKVLTAQLAAARQVRPALADEGWDGVHDPRDDTRLVPAQFLLAPAAAARQKEAPMALDFGLQISRFSWPGGPAETAERLATVAGEAERAGFTSIWVITSRRSGLRCQPGG